MVNHAHQLCGRHYKRLQRTGDPLVVRPSGRKTKALISTEVASMIQEFIDLYRNADDPTDLPPRFYAIRSQIATALEVTK